MNPSKICLARGLSVYTNIADAQNYVKLYPNKGTYVAQATLNNTDGHVSATPSKGNSHHTWWPFDGVDRKALFT